MKQLSKDEAARLVVLINLAAVRLEYRSHYTDMEWGRGYDRSDLFYLLANGEIDSEPEYDPDFDNFKVRISGLTVDGRPTRVVLGMNPRQRTAYLITIIDRERR